ncbi:MHYT domain-containing protein [Telmatobacter bradus]|uniref:MHYT domain-containing protein n=1 Tax=Telmatobacter bradus TaxID=474953 RepID=UPI003B42FC3F
MNSMSSIAGTYDYRLVALSLVLAFVTSYTALDLGGRVRANQGGLRIVWLTGGAFAMGSGIWCMHYTGMLAFHLPIPVFYHVPTVVLSLLASITSSLIAFYVVSRDSMTSRNIAVGSVLMGGGIAAMHYIGMSAMRLEAMHHYKPWLWTLSVVLAIIISFIGLRLIYYTRDGNRSRKLKFIIALIMGMAIPTMHYTGMAAVSFMPDDVAPDLSQSVGITALAIFAIVVVTVLVLGVALIAALVDRQLFVQRSKVDEERATLRALINNIPDYMYVKDLKSRFVVANPYLARQVGVETPEELLGKTDFDFYPRELAENFYQDEQNVIQSGQPLYNHEEKGIDRAGNEVDILTTKVPIRDAKGKIIGIAGVGRDITVLKGVENALREAELKYRGIFDKAFFGIYQSTPDGNLLNVNSAMAFTFGYDSPEEMIASVTDLSKQLFVDSKRGVEFMLVMDKVGGVRNFECEVYCKGGRRIWLSMSIRAIRQNGTVVRYEGMCDEITERKLLRDQLFQAQKLESVGQLAAGIAHEINTPTQFIGDNVQFLKDSFVDLKSPLAGYARLQSMVKDNTLSYEVIREIAAEAERADIPYLLEEIPQAIDQALEGVSRVSTLVNAMKEFSHPGTKDKIPLDLNHAIESTITVARNEWKYVAEMETNYDPSLPMVSCQPGEFNQVILNLIVNAAHAISDVIEKGKVEKGMIRIKTQKFPGWAEIRVQDTGTGIPENVRIRIFDPFFTTKEIGKGTGQGLAIARSVIVDRHGGTIHCETEVGKGTTFIIRMPYEGKRLSTSGETA